MKHKILIIAGSDPSGGAGIQADIKTATALKTYSSCVISCLTAQNTAKVYDVFYPPISFLEKQILAVFDDIKFDAVKIGMLGNLEITKSVAKILQEKTKSSVNNLKIITDPVMVATSGDKLLKDDAISVLKKELISISYLVTPNTDEAEILADMKIRNLNDVKIAAAKIQKLGAKNVLIKGGHLNLGDKIHNYLLMHDGRDKIFTNKKLPYNKIHGTGCTLATAISSFVAQGIDLEDAIKKANLFVLKAIKNGKNIGHGSRILQHF